MKSILTACIALVAFAWAAPAEDLPPLSQFLSQCYRDSTVCRAKLRDYITAADAQKSICRPAGQSVGEASSALLNWLRSDQRPAGLEDLAFDEGLWQASSTMWPCKPDAPAAPPAAPAEPAPPPSGNQ